MKQKSATIQYTIRSVPRSVDRALRRMAATANQSLNAVLLDVVSRAVGGDPENREHRDLDSFIGSWVADPATDAALISQRSLHPKDWA